MSKLICLQMGHSGLTTGATGAPGEKVWLEKFVPMVATILENNGYDVYQTDANAQKDPRVTATNWDLFLAVHYDADIYNDRGGFIDIPDASVDAATAESTRIANAMKVFFTKTGIPQKPERSNANTKFYYMWQYLTSETPCVIIECGVGNRKPEDYTTLRTNIDSTAKYLAEAIMNAFGPTTVSLEKKIEELEDQIIGLRSSRDEWKAKYKLEAESNAKTISEKDDQIESLQKTSTELTTQLTVMNRQVQSAIEEKNALAGTLTETKKIQEELNIDIVTLKDKNTNLQIKIDRGIKGFSKWELLRAILFY